MYTYSVQKIKTRSGTETTDNGNETERLAELKRTNVIFFYNSGADGHYPTEVMQKAAGLAILGKLIKQMIITDGNTAKGKHHLPCTQNE